MARVLKHKRGTTAQHAAYTGPVGEVTVDTDKRTLVVHDGVTPGGQPLAAAGESGGGVEHYANFAAFPATGSTSKAYVADDTDVLYVWDGTAYVRTKALEYITDAQYTASPNNTVYVNAFEATSPIAANVDICLKPKGTGSLLADVPDNLSSGGNKRGVRAVDWQTERTTATQVASANYSVISGGKSNVTATGATYSVVAGGNSNSIGSAGTNATIGGGTLNSANANNATVCGGTSNTASGDGSTASGGGNTASGTNAIAMGNGCIASGGFGSVAMGQSNTASGISAVAMGQSNTASGISAVAMGQSAVADGHYSTALGAYSQAFSVTGAIAHSSGRVTTTGDVQTRGVTLFTQTTNATPTVLRTTTSAVSSSNILNNRNYTLQAIKGRCIARTPGSTVDYAVWEFTALLNRGANAASSALLAAVAPTLLASGGTGGTWGLSVTADTTNGGLLVTGTGEAGKIITWGCDVNALEVQDLS